MVVNNKCRYVLGLYVEGKDLIDFEKYRSGSIDFMYVESVPLLNSIDLLIVDIDFIDQMCLKLLLENNSWKNKIILYSKNSEQAISLAIFSVFDFWLKPVQKDYFIRILSKIDKIKIEKANSSIGKIYIAHHEGIDWVNWRDVLRIQADRTYCIVYFLDGKSKLVSISLKAMEEQINICLPHAFFFRSHKSHLINLIHLDKYVKINGGYLKMIDESTIPISVNRKNELIQLMKII